MKSGLRLSDLTPEQREIEREKKRAYNKLYRLRNIERIREQKRQYEKDNADRLREERAREYLENKEKHREKNRAQYLKHRDKRLAYAKAYNDEHRDERTAYSKKRYAEKHDEIRAKCREIYRSNPDKFKAEVSRYRKTNSEKVKESKRRYNQTPAGKANHHGACIRRRAKMNDNAKLACDKGIHWKALAEKQGSMRCSVCGRECVCTEDRKGSMYPTVDHIIPISRGGTHTWNNVRLVCRGCNASKKDKIISAASQTMSIAQMGQGG